MAEENRGYIEALEVVLDGGKLSLTLSAAPLAIIAAQVSILVELESVWLKTLVTLTILIFSFASFASLAFVVACRMVLAKEKLLFMGSPTKGTKMLDWVERILKKNDQQLNEDYILFVTKLYSVPAACLLGPGLILMVATLIVAVWQ